MNTATTVAAKCWGSEGRFPPEEKYYPQIKSYYQSVKYSHLERGGGVFKTFFQNGHFEGWGVFLKGGFLVIPTD